MVMTGKNTMGFNMFSSSMGLPSFPTPIGNLGSMESSISCCSSLCCCLILILILYFGVFKKDSEDY